MSSAEQPSVPAVAPVSGWAGGAARALGRTAVTIGARPFLSWGLAALLSAAAILLRLAIDDLLPPGFQYVTFFPAVILTTFLCGLWPGIAAAAVCGLAAWYFFIPPYHSFALTPSTALALAFYLLIVGIVIAIIEVMHRALGRLQEEEARGRRLAEQREWLFRELQHRTSNNLAMVSAMLSLQRSSIPDETARAALANAAARISAIARINRELHDPKRQALAYRATLRSILDEVIDLSDGPKVTLEVTGDEVRLPGDRAVPLSLIVTELVSNALEHAFVGRNEGRIEVGIDADERAGTLSVTVADNGRGLPPGFDARRAQSLGFRIIRSLTAQLGGTLDMREEHGTTARLVIPLVHDA